MSIEKNLFSVAGNVVVLCAVQSVCQPILPVTQDPHLMIECAPRGGYVQHHLEEATAYVRACLLLSPSFRPETRPREGTGAGGEGGAGVKPAAKGEELPKSKPKAAMGCRERRANEKMPYTA